MNKWAAALLCVLTMIFGMIVGYCRTNENEEETLGKTLAEDILMIEV